MATIYEYSDTYVVGSIEDTELEREESVAIDYVNQFDVEDGIGKEKMVQATTYIALATKQLEAGGMRARVDAYRKEFDRYYQLAKSGNDRGVRSIGWGRG